MERADTKKIVIATDLHFLAPELMDGGKAFRELQEFSDGRVTGEGPGVAAAFLEDTVNLRPDAVLFTGDLTFNGERASHAYLAGLFEKLKKSGIPVAALPGNHDLENLMAGAYLGDEGHPVASVSRREFARFYGIPRQAGALVAARFARGGRFLRDPHSLGYAFAVGEKLWILCVDGNGNGAPGEVSGGTLAWVEAVLACAARRGVRVIGASHQNLLEHNSLISQGYLMLGAEKLLALYETYGVHLHLSGHMHVQHWAYRPFGNPWENGLTEIVTSALCIPPCGYGLLTVSGDSFRYEAKTVGEGAFSACREEFLAGNRKCLLAELTDESLRLYRDRLADGMARLNLAYYSGALCELPEREYIRDAWKRCVPDSFWNLYADSMLERPVKDERRCEGRLV